MPAVGSIALRARTLRGQLRLAGLLHPFRWGAAAPVIDTNALARQLAGPLGIGSIESLAPRTSSAHQLSLDAIGPHRIAAWVGSAVAITGGLVPVPTLYLVRGGWLEWEGQDRRERLQPGGLLYLNSPAYRLRSGVCSVVAIAFDPLRLEAQLRKLAAAGLGEEASRKVLTQSVLGGQSGASWGHLVRAISSLLDLFERLVLTDPRLVPRLELDRLLERLVVTLLLASAGGLEALDLAGAEAVPPPRDAIFEALLVRIRAQLAQPINLATLEGWSQRSRRELQVVFRDRLGCTPMQWVRRERLRRARLRLEQPAPGDTVANIARASGYPSASRFSADFRREFRCTPSQLLQASPAPRTPVQRQE